MLPEKQYNIDENVLQRMLSMYPFGHIFSSDELGILETTDADMGLKAEAHPSRQSFFARSDTPTWKDDEDAPDLFEGFDQARSIMFLPLWDYTKERWSAAALGWTTDLTRIFDINDMQYLSAFSNSIMAEMSKIEASVVSKSKSDFISVVSHEVSIICDSAQLKQALTLIAA